MLEGLLMPIVAAAVMLAVLVAILVIVVRSSMVKRREQTARRATWVDAPTEPGDAPGGRHRDDGRRQPR